MKLKRSLLVTGAATALVASSMLAPSAATAHDGSQDGPDVRLLADLGDMANGSTIGPDGALYVAVGTEGKVVKIDPRTGEVRTFAEGLPTPAIPYGGAVDVAFLGKRAYVLVTLVDEEVGGSAANGVYRIDDRDDHTLIADLSEFNRDFPPDEVDLASGNPFAIHAVGKGFLVTDGNANRLLQVSKRGHVKELVQFGNVVPTGIETSQEKIYVGQAGPLPHEAEDGRVVSLKKWNLREREVADGYPLILDVEFGGCKRLYALSNGKPAPDAGVADPAQPDTGALLRVRNGAFREIVDGLNQPTSLDFKGDTAFVTSLDGSVWRIDDVGGRCGHDHD